MSEAEYRVRQHAFEPERVWRVGPAGFAWQVGEKAGHFAFSEITSIRLSFTPTRFDSARYRCTVTRFNGWRENFASTSYAGIGSFEDRGRAYGVFVRALVDEATRANPAIRLEAGESSLRYWSSILILVAALLLLAVILLSVGFNATWIVIVKLMVIAFLLPIGLRWIAKNRPRSFAPDAIPADVLPSDASEHRQ
jgi:hypothetical protein